MSLQIEKYQLTFLPFKLFLGEDGPNNTCNFLQPLVTETVQSDGLLKCFL